MDLRAWVAERGGIVHRSDVLDQGVTPQALRAAVSAGAVQRVRRSWIATPDAPAMLRAAAESTARVACVSAARHRGWWMPPDADAALHLHLSPHAARPRSGDAVHHWTLPIGVVHARRLIESVEDTLQHIADCQRREVALVLWEDAVRIERLSPRLLQRVAWRSPAARDLASALTGLMGSGSRTCSSRGSARGTCRWTCRYTVLRFSYVEVIHRWDVVEHALARALAQRRR